MKRKVVAILLTMAVCANSTTAAFAKVDSNLADVEWGEASALVHVNGPSASESKGSLNTVLSENKITDILENAGYDDNTTIDPIPTYTETVTTIDPGSSTTTETVTETTSDDTTSETEQQDPSDNSTSETEQQDPSDNSTPEIEWRIPSGNTVTEEEEIDDPLKDLLICSIELADTGKKDEKGNPILEFRDTTDETWAKLKEDAKKKKKSKLTKEQQAIVDYAKSIGYKDGRRWTDKGDNIFEFNHQYAEDPVIGKDSCSPGKLADPTLQEGLNLVNLIRKTAGLGEVTLDDDYNNYAQYGALIMAAAGKMSHTPPHADNITDEQYKLGYEMGTSNSNIGYNQKSLTDSILNGYMHDGNSKTMGHRRWILNPAMGKVGFGQVNEYNDMYAHDSSSRDTLKDFVAWPAQNMPMELMPYSGNNGNVSQDTPWTCQLGSDYKFVSADKLTITVTRPDGTDYVIPQNNIICNNEPYGYTNGCISFRDKAMYGEIKKGDSPVHAGDTFKVKIEGVKDKNGKTTAIEYDVNFFELGL